jgi:hypothetical protein
MSSLQTARVTKKGDVGFAIGYSNILNNKGEELFSRYHFWELNVRYGLAEKCDVGIELAFPLPTTLDIKYQFVGNDSSLIACSVGFGLSIYSIEHIFQSTGILLPLYASFHPAKEFALYISPRLYSFLGEGDHLSYAGITSGMRLGGDFALLLEYSIYTIFGNNEFASQLTGALSYKIP